jgi:hypothetical protein
MERGSRVVEAADVERGAGVVWLSVYQVMDFEGAEYQTVYRWMKSGRLVWKPDPNRKHGRLINPLSMSPGAQQRWRDSLLREATEPKPGDSGAQLDLLPQTKEDQAVRNALLLLSPHQRGPVMQRFRALQPLLNHDFAAMGYATREDYTNAAAGQLRITARHLQRIRAKWSKNYAEGGHAKAIAGLATEKRGPERGHGSKIDPSMGAFIAMRWLDPSKPSRMQVSRDLDGYVGTKQRGTGGSFIYPEIPSRSAVACYINRELGGDSNPLRNGAEAVKETAGYILRSYDDERAGDAWCIDEWELDCYCFDDRDHRIVYNYGRRNPILHLLSAIDERTTFIMGWILTASVDRDTLELAERLVRQYWLPQRLVCDRAGRFRALAHGRVVARESGELAEKLMGPLGELGGRAGARKKSAREPDRADARALCGSGAARLRAFVASAKASARIPSRDAARGDGD